ncbi:nuclear transport factor 2 family protein [Granulicella sibirica]|uniref:DUF4440 domain-containing protein n=1 Tax=Granulicella sibirica TaxID=2479048 RepID=A0A4Q0T0G7_9BACT|nr:nuclear transport factor 2 family protein [Granulicella sibirica]RXH55299.1 hypothetical protein GRAN_4403 [Granulicella sibirica]
MRFFLCALPAMLLAGSFAAPLKAATPEEQAVLAPVQAVFDGMAKRDAGAIQQPLLPGGMIFVIRDGKTTQVTFSAFAERVGRPGPKIEERIHGPVVHIDGDLAVVWAPFDFLLEGKVDHCGTDLFNLVRTNGTWQIATIAYNSHTDCPAR